ncbi:hypothetical protein CHS0354_006274 [Potamilus streckersoni]|uniref:Soluble Rieske-type ferredoxin domain-containing protein n=1 Tax=Potamilus streckersoni TaxID=2493646 RepID=A0AAE0S4N6_9BIVA|nr:hypothetical protein CHS0354_006274 [Potamilus streckersoni]
MAKQEENEASLICRIRSCHMGGPLYKGDIEDFNGRTCIRCPWHRYCVTIDTGESLYQSIDPYNAAKPPEWRSMGRKQRTHTVTVREGNIYVTLSDPSQHFASDQYNKVNSS